MFNRFTERAMLSLDDLVRLVKDLEPKVRASYSESINLTPQQLVKLILLDAAFIIELFIIFQDDDEAEDIISRDAKFSQSWLHIQQREDLILLENQLPFCVIEELFNKALPEDHRDSLPSFRTLASEYFVLYNAQELEPDPNVEIQHFTDLIRLFYVQGKMSKRKPLIDEAGCHMLLYNVNALQEAGIKLKASENKSLFDLKFSEIPQILVEASTKLVFGNVIAFEECYYCDETYFADYALLLDWLIDTSKDVDILVHNKIVTHSIGDTNKVALVLNNISEKVIHSTFRSEFHDRCKNLNYYCEHPWHKMKATLRRDYCRTSWQIVASIAAIVLLIPQLFKLYFLSSK